MCTWIRLVSPFFVGFLNVDVRKKFVSTFQLVCSYAISGSAPSNLFFFVLFHKSCIKLLVFLKGGSLACFLPLSGNICFTDVFTTKVSANCWRRSLFNTEKILYFSWFWDVLIHTTDRKMDTCTEHNYCNNFFSLLPQPGKSGTCFYEKNMRVVVCSLLDCVASDYIAPFLPWPLILLIHAMHSFNWYVHILS